MDDKNTGVRARDREERIVVSLFLRRSRVPMRLRWIAWAASLGLDAVAVAVTHGEVLMGALAFAATGPLLLEVAWTVLFRRDRLPASWLPNEG